MDNVYIYNRFISNKDFTLPQLFASLEYRVHFLELCLSAFNIKPVRAFSDIGMLNECFDKMVKEMPYGSTIAVAELSQVGKPSNLRILAKKGSNVAVVGTTFECDIQVYSAKELYDNYKTNKKNIS